MTIRVTKGALVAALGLVAAAQAALLAAIPLLMDALELGADRLGAAIAAGLAVTLLLAPRAGRLADHWSSPRIARAGLVVIFAASLGLCGYTVLLLGRVVTAEAAFLVVLAARIANGVGVALLHPAAQAWLWSGVGDEDGVRLQGWASAAQNTGRFIGPVGVGLIGGAGAAWTLAGLVVLCASAVLVLATAPGPATRPERSARGWERAGQGSPASASRLLLAALLALHLLAGGAQFLLGPLLMARLDLDAPDAARWAGWLMAMAAAASVVGNLLARRMRGPRRSLAGAGLAAVGAILLAPFAHLALVATGVVAIAVGIGIAVPSAMAELTRRAPVQARGRTAGRTSATQAAAHALAAPAYGVLFSVAPGIAAAMLPVPAAAAWLLLDLSRRGARRDSDDR
jgi:hypothetical protein